MPSGTQFSSGGLASDGSHGVLSARPLAAPGVGSLSHPESSPFLAQPHLVEVGIAPCGAFALETQGRARSGGSPPCMGDNFAEGSHDRLRYATEFVGRHGLRVGR